MPVLLMVVDRMSERKVAPVLAAMSPTKAKDVTVQLAEQRKLQKNRPGATALPPAGADASGAPADSNAQASAANASPDASAASR
jgi:flagellar motility protein MotE (MotC chaperone)